MNVNHAKLIDFIHQAFEAWNVPTLGVVVVNKGGIELCDVFNHPNGSKDANLNTLFPFASITKAFSATAVSVLAQQGKLRWDDPVQKHCPDFALSDPWVSREFQIIDLFCHRAGLGVQPLEQMPLWGYSREDIKTGLKHIPFPKSFRTTYEYNNVLYLWGEDLVEHVSGKSWKEFMASEVLQPLGMLGTGIGPKWADPSRLIKGHIYDEIPPHSLREVEFSVYPDVLLGAGGLVGPVEDLAQWMLFQLGHKKAHPIIDDGLRRFMQRPQTVIGPRQSYGLGWRILDNRPQRVVSHGGLIKGIKHQLWLIPELDCGIAVLSNFTDCDAAPAIVEYYADLAMGIPEKNYHELFLEAAKLVKKEPFPTITSLPLQASNFCGHYQHPFLGSGEVLSSSDHLTFTFGPKPASTILWPIGGNAFMVVFNSDYGGKVGESHWGTATFDGTQLTLRGFDRFDNETFVFSRV